MAGLIWNRSTQGFRSALGERRALGLMKWLAIALPLVFLGAADVVREHLFPHHTYDLGARAFFFGVLAIAIFLFAETVFAVIERLQMRIVCQNDHLSTLNGIASASAESAGLGNLLDDSLVHVLSGLRADAGLICTVDLELGEHSAVASRGFSSELVKSIRRARLCDDPIASQVVATGAPVALLRAFDDPRVAEIAAREGVHSAISVPLKSHGKVTGIMAVATRTERRFGTADLELLSSVGGQLGMAIRHATVFELSLQRTREMEALLAISRAVAASLDLPLVLDRALEAILEVTSAEAAEIWLVHGDGTLARDRSVGSATPLEESTSFWEGADLPDLPDLVIASREPVLVHDVAGDDRFLGTAVRRAGFQTYCALPLLHREAPLGVLVLVARDPHALTRSEELKLLAGVGEVIGVAIENARLYERVQDTAVLEERERLAREMHDGLAQMLTYVNAQSLAIGKLLGAGHLEDARRELAQLEQRVQEAYGDVREAILGLRTSPRAPGGLLASLARYLESFEDMTNIRTRLEVDEAAVEATLPSAVEIQLTRIVQEALANVRKHARAKTARVCVEPTGDGLRIVVADDGRGFDPTRLEPQGWPRFGLQTMRERAEAVGGSFLIISQPGEGTRVTVELSAGRHYTSPARVPDRMRAGAA